MTKYLTALGAQYFLIAAFLCLGTMQLPAQSIFQKTYGGSRPEEGFAIEATADSGFIIAGQTTSYGHGNSDIFVFKTNKDGQTQWAQAIGDTAMDVAFGLALTPDGGFIVAGMTSSFGDMHSDTNVIIYKGGGGTTFTKIFGAGGLRSEE